MSKLMDDRINEVRKMVSIEIAGNLLEMGGLTYEEIAKVTHLTAAEIEEIAEEFEAEKARQ